MADEATGGTALLDLKGSGAAMVRGASGVAARAEAETKAMIVMAYQNPRDEAAAYAALAGACTRPTFAAAARYSYPRGGEEIDGLSIGFAREAARVWGNIVSGVEIVAHLTPEEHPPHGRVDIFGFAWDLQSNRRVHKPATFKALIFRKKGGWQKPDERDFRELVARHGAVAERNAILDLIPPDVKEDLLDRLRKTSVGKAEEDLKRNRKTIVEKLRVAFGNYGVTEDMLCHLVELDNLDAMDAAQLSRLRAVFAGMEDGAVVASEVFPELGGAAAASGQSTQAATADAELDAASEDDVPEPEPVPAAPAKRGAKPAPAPAPAAEEKAAPKKRGKPAPPPPADEEEEVELRVAEGAWVGDLPAVNQLPAVFTALKEAHGEDAAEGDSSADTLYEQVVLDMYQRDERPGAAPHYAVVMGELGYDV